MGKWVEVGREKCLQKFQIIAREDWVNQTNCQTNRKSRKWTNDSGGAECEERGPVGARQRESEVTRYPSQWVPRVPSPGGERVATSHPWEPWETISAADTSAAIALLCAPAPLTCGESRVKSTA